MEVPASCFRPCSSQRSRGNGSLILAGAHDRVDDDAVDSSTNRLGVVERRNCRSGRQALRTALRFITELAIGLIADRGQPAQVREVGAVRDDGGIDSRAREATLFVPHVKAQFQ
jgi:hypothetical protein